MGGCVKGSGLGLLGWVKGSGTGAARMGDGVGFFRTQEHGCKVEGASSERLSHIECFCLKDVALTFPPLSLTKEDFGVLTQ